MSATNSHLKIVSSERLHARNLPDKLQILPLSILDWYTSNFSCFWVYHSPIDPSQLRSSLLRTIENGYTPWCGQLRTVRFTPGAATDHTQRFTRLILELAPNPYENPGIEYVVARHSSNLEALFPAREPDVRVWSPDPQTQTSGLLSKEPPLAFHNNVDFQGLPNVLIQVTTFADGGTVVAVKMVHCLGDAQSLTTFVKDWARIHHSLFVSGSSPTNVPPPVFNPSMIDEAALGDIDASVSDPNIIKISRSLPINRYDWWVPPSSGEVPAWGAAYACRPPHLVNATEGIDHGEPMPWDEWEYTIPVAQGRIHFSADDIDRIWTACATTVPGVTISKLDALQAYLWTLTERARRDLHAKHNDTSVNLAIALGVRERLQPRLPSNFLGCLILGPSVKIPLNSKGELMGSLSDIAAAIRRTIEIFDAEAIGAVLHDMAHEPCPYHVLTTFMGRRHCLVTSWMRLGTYEVDFGTGPPSVVEVELPMASDGLIHLMEAPRIVEGEPGLRWYGEGIIASVYLREDVMKNFLADNGLAAVVEAVS